MRSKLSIAVCCWLLVHLQVSGSQASSPNFLILMADNWSAQHLSIAGDPVVRTPNIDHVAARGVRFESAFCLCPSCSPARAAFLTGQTIHRLQDAANLHGRFPSRLQVFPQLLASAGYRVGFSGKGWAPGNWQISGWKSNPAGESYSSFKEFLEGKNANELDQFNKPFLFWFSSKHPHVPWEEGQERKTQLDSAKINLPKYLPDNELVRENVLDYLVEVELFDQQCADHLRLLDQAGLSENTVVIICGDNGWQMPHGLANVYDAGTRVPLIVAGPTIRPQASPIKDLVNFDDLAPTILEIAGASPLKDATGSSLAKLLSGEVPSLNRPAIYLSRERHANVRQGNASYPIRAVRTTEFLYVRNFEPDRWPAGDPATWFAVGPFGDVDYTYTKRWILENRDEPSVADCFRVNFDKRPAEELYDLSEDPDQVYNRAAEPKFAERLSQLRRQLIDWMTLTADPRAVDPHDDYWDKADYFGRAAGPNDQRPKAELEGRSPFDKNPAK